MDLHIIKAKIAPAGVIMGAIIVVAGYISTGKDVVSWGWPVWIWQTVGAAIFFVCVIAILYNHQKDIDSMKLSKINNSHITKKDRGVPPESLGIANKEIEKLNKENKRLTEVSSPLWAIRNQQLQNLKYSNPMLVMTKLESIQFHGLKNPEPIVIVQFNFYNLSIFKLELKDINLLTKLNNNDLSLPSSLMTESTIMTHSTSSLLQFKQPMASGTADLLKNSIEKREKIMWEFTFKAKYSIEDTKEVGSFTHPLKYEGIPFWVT